MDDTAQRLASGLLARFRRHHERDGISEQDVIVCRREDAEAMMESRDLSGWGRLDLPTRPGLVPIPLSLFLSPILAMGITYADRAVGEDVMESSPPPICGPPMTRPHRWPRGLPCPTGFEDGGDD